MTTDKSDSLDTPLSGKITSEELASVLRVLRKIVPNSQRSVQQPDPLEAALRIYGARRERRHFLPEDIFSDPAWDMLIFLYCKEGQGQLVTITSLCHSSDTPATTALRWVAELERRGLIERHPHPTDGRSVTAKLAETARAGLTAYFERVSAHHLGL